MNSEQRKVLDGVDLVQIRVILEEDLAIVRRGLNMFVGHHIGDVREGMFKRELPHVPGARLMAMKCTEVTSRWVELKGPDYPYDQLIIEESVKELKELLEARRVEITQELVGAHAGPARA